METNLLKDARRHQELCAATSFGSFRETANRLFIIRRTCLLATELEWPADMNLEVIPKPQKAQKTRAEK
jgi:hypothetical protein